MSMVDEAIAPEVRKEIMRRLARAEQEHDVKIIYACESGSRAWGFASPDSDYDVRFIYVHRRDWYLSFDVETRRDVIEYPIVDEMDCGGWDLRKALYLFTRTNGALFEWLRSPIQYIEEGPTAATLRSMAPQCFNRIALRYHYSHMARGNAREYLFKDEVRLKKYFYVLRPLFAIRYIEKFDQPPPVPFGDLVAAVCPPELIAPIERLLEIKKLASEKGMGAPVPAINAFIQSELDRHGEAFTGHGRPDIHDSDATRAALNEVFRRCLSSYV